MTRTIWLGRLICDLKPDTVNLISVTALIYLVFVLMTKGRSLLKDEGTRTTSMRTLTSKTNSGPTVRSSKNDYHGIESRIIGNHEQRIERAINCTTHLRVLLVYSDLQLDRYYTMSGRIRGKHRNG